jgi:hypothetical protein
MNCKPVVSAFSRLNSYGMRLMLAFPCVKLQTIDVAVTRPYSKANDNLPASGFDGQSVLEEEVVVFGVINVVNVLSLCIVRAECEFVWHPLVIGIEKPGSRKDKNVAANAGLFEFIIDDP